MALPALTSRVPTGHSISAPQIEAPVRRFYVAFEAAAEGGGFVCRWASVSAQTPGGALRIARITHPDCSGFRIVGTPAALQPSAHPQRRASDLGRDNPGEVAHRGERRRITDRAMAF